jgi:hypothetical protein
MGSGCIDPHFLDLGTSWGEGSVLRPGRFTPEKGPRYPLYRRLGGPQSRSGRHGVVKILEPTGLELRHLGRPARSHSLYRLRSPGPIFLWTEEDHESPYESQPPRRKSNTCDCEYEAAILISQKNKNGG